LRKTAKAELPQTKARGEKHHLMGWKNGLKMVANFALMLSKIK